MTLRYQTWIPWIAALLLFALTVASRTPFASRLLYAWDSANFALALNRYNVAFEQPHAPGYPLYVATAWLVNIFVQNANDSFVWISIIASAGAAAVLFLLASRMYDAWIGLTSALLLVATVGFWGYGEVAYPYATLAFFGTLVAWLCYLMWQGHRWIAVLCGLVLGIAGGMREDALLFLGPLWLVSVWRVGLVRLLLSALVLGLTVASWLFSAVELSGGWAAYQQAGVAQSSYILATYSVLNGSMDGVRRNVETFLIYLKQMFGLSLVVAVYFSGRFLTLKGLVADRRLVFLLLWLLPPVLVYTLIHIGDPGYILSILPPLCIATAVGIWDIALDTRSALLLLAGRYGKLSGLARIARGAGSGAAALLLLVLVLWNANAFLLTPGPARLIEIRTIDNILANQTKYAKSLQPESVVVLAKARYRQFKYYLPGYNVRLLFDEYQQGHLEARSSYRIPQGVNTVLVMDFGKASAQFPDVSGSLVTWDDLPGATIWKFDVRQGDTIQYGYDYFGIIR